MMRCKPSRFCRAFALAASFAALSVSAGAEETTAKSSPDTPADESEAFEHPLTWTINFANARSDYIRRSIRDYTCRLIKRERIDGKLQDYQFARLKVRSEQRRDEQLVRPMAVFMQFLAPASFKDRRVLYVDGENDGQLLVRKGGSLMKHAKLSIDPHGAAARRDSNYPITEIGFDKLVDRLVQRAKEDIQRDPRAENTSVSYFGNAMVGDRKCMHIRVVHPEPGNGMEFHTASLYVDDELQLPIRLVVNGWPEREGEKPPINEEFTYVDLRLNLGLTDADFSESQLQTSARSRTTTASAPPR